MTLPFDQYGHHLYGPFHPTDAPSTGLIGLTQEQFDALQDGTALAEENEALREENEILRGSVKALAKIVAELAE